MRAPNDRYHLPRYLLSSRDKAAVNRANFTGYIAITLLTLIPWMTWSALIVWEAVRNAAILLPVLMAAAWAGSRLFRHSSEALYRHIAFGLLFCAEVFGLVRYAKGHWY